ncbi:hypothetical protein EYF80_031383 [Liparis tanakae]|uniref:Uncharacterized protein n=1 Tax=Liparis tanakae TaxID=230148 RepID=A0A4Z2H0G1_9TELE|nr:hypothetical protein EYF80_031383 [Liparis tanakae]
MSFNGPRMEMSHNFRVKTNTPVHYGRESTLCPLGMLTVVSVDREKKEGDREDTGQPSDAPDIVQRGSGREGERGGGDVF